ncbi:probable disease resistance protein At4g27220 [Lycium ferocissimum]|uniref:probable disease resistance protein At4g27220 n=1 Tax=Lycium ferocissimum TaxID=112874 RepID=UPI002814E97D|nr:probable disease resistance protein At4g27220 [Lycium ferocissimum]
MENAVSVVLAILAVPLKWAWNGAKKQCLYCIKYKESAEAFESEAREFLEKAKRLEDTVEKSGRRSVREELKPQLDRAKDVENKVNLLTTDMEKARPACCLWHYKLSKRIAKLREAMGELIQDPKFNSVVALQPQAAAIWQRSRNIQRPKDFLSFSSRKLSMDEIMNALKDEGRSIARVHGMGGVGKTYMVKALASRALKERIFDQVVVSVVSQNFDLRKIQGDIAHGLGVELTSIEVQDRANDLKDILMDHSNILLILDDLWQTIDDLSDIGIPQNSEDIQRSGGYKCKILITTRKRYVCDNLDRHPPIPINVLSGDDPWILFSQRAGDKSKQAGFIEIGKKIVKECAGLPIALSTVGSALRNKDLGSWQSAATRLERSKAPSIDQDDDLSSVVSESIELSYSFLPNDLCKRFFLMCSFFPEDHNIPKETLTRYGMGLSLIPNIESVKEARDDAHLTFEELKASSLLLDGDKEDTVKMHDVIRDISIQISINQQPMSVVKAGLALKDWPRDTLKSSCGAISLMSNHIQSLPDDVDCPETEMLLLQNNKSLKQVPLEFFGNMKALKVLDFTGVKLMRSLPSSTKQLSLLRILSLDYCRLIRDVSMIGGLTKLEILSLRESRFASLPESFAHLKELRILDITLSPCKEVPPGIISSMKKLEELYMQGCFADWENGNGQNKASFQEILSLSGLTTLKVDLAGVSCLPPDDPDDTNLDPHWEKFDVCVNGSEVRRLLNARGPSSSSGLATGLQLKEFPNWFTQAVARKAEKLSYQECILEEYRPENFDSVKLLYVEQCVEHCSNGAQFIKLESGVPIQPVFPKLEKLNIHQMQEMEGICAENLPSGSLHKLKTLEVHECPNLKDALLPPNLVQRMSNLEEVHATGNSIKVVFGFEGLTVRGGELRKLKRLILHNLSQLTSLWKGTTELVMFHRLEVVKLSQCEKLKYIFPYSVCDFLCHLQVLWLEDCSSLEQVIGDHKDGNGVHEAPEDMILPRLRDLVLGNLPCLTHFYTQKAYLRCPELQRLHVKDCQRLRTNLSDYHSDQEIQLIPEKQLKRLETFRNSAQ